MTLRNQRDTLVLSFNRLSSSDAFLFWGKAPPIGGCETWIKRNIMKERKIVETCSRIRNVKSDLGFIIDLTQN